MYFLLNANNNIHYRLGTAIHGQGKEYLSFSAVQIINYDLQRTK